MTRTYAAILLLLSSTFVNGHSNEKSLTSSKDYFGEKPPGLTPKLFEPKLVSPEGRFEGGTFSPNMEEFYFSRKNGKYKSGPFLLLDTKTIVGGQNPKPT